MSQMLHLEASHRPLIAGQPINSYVGCNPFTNYYHNKTWSPMVPTVWSSPFSLSAQNSHFFGRSIVGRDLWSPVTNSGQAVDSQRSSPELPITPPLMPSPPPLSSVSPIGCQTGLEWTTNFWNHINRELSQSPDPFTQWPLNITNNMATIMDTNQSFNGDNAFNSFGYQELPSPVGAPIGTPPKGWLNGKAPAFLSSLPMTTSRYVQPRVRRRRPTQTECVFCKNNNQTPEVYKSHILKDPECRITCPVLRAYDCPICHNGGGERAHTVRYCPLNRAGARNLPNDLMASKSPVASKSTTEMVANSTSDWYGSRSAKNGRKKARMFSSNNV